jgi:ankyrin repeat protein
MVTGKRKQLRIPFLLLLIIPCSSPLNTAFYSGRVDIVRLLLDANAELEYVNRRRWTPAQYIYDPQLCNLHTIELLDIYACRDFDQWDSQDAAGWTILHRASAFGRGKDIRKLLHLRASSIIYTFTLNWLPLFCSVKFGNESTFDVLADLIPRRDFPILMDVRGWTLLHLAAENGSEVLMTKLLRRGLDPYMKSDASSLAVPEGLELLELIPGDIAKRCNNQEAYERALKGAGRPTSVG